MVNTASRFLTYILAAALLLVGPMGAHESLDGTSEPLQLKETVFEANGSPLYVLNARARVENVGEKGYRGSTVHFFFRLDSSESWTLIGQRPLPGIPPGDSVVCDLVTSSEGLPFVDSGGEVHSSQYRVEVHYDDGVTAKEGEFHPACIHDDEDHHEHDDHHDDHEDEHPSL